MAVHSTADALCHARGHISVGDRSMTLCGKPAGRTMRHIPGGCRRSRCEKCAALMKQGAGVDVVTADVPHDPPSTAADKQRRAVELLSRPCSYGDLLEVVEIAIGLLRAEGKAQRGESEPGR